ncbi:segregation and condensation protein A [Peptostreptococcus canis]|uniref:Segregation and condensation protein A n=1 Tax=Peptostreptococcus canis TaxID=1159213 RepID=A0ABR6TK81_9FIRM|nr:segregation/condensation protein A [Peptostreptococcus canis]MBC2575822.1 segregation/condensation protein A [Peptostreptococcus canis]MBP1998062.1 segregation and condensation protein A [Peptostreptococcus canis]
MNYSIQTKKYEGPMDLIFDLISRNKIDISDISIVEITEQYIEYVNDIKDDDLELASDFIAMASKLIEIKSRYILYMKYSNDTDEDPRNELVQKIEEYKKFRNITDNIKDNIKEYEDRFYRDKLEIFDDEIDFDLSSINIDEIKILLPLIFGKTEEDKFEKSLEKNQNLKKIIKNKIIPVEFKIEEIREKIFYNDSFLFKDILNSNSKSEVIASFLAILELIKIKEINILQSGFYNDIIIKKNKSGDVDEKIRH